MVTAMFHANKWRLQQLILIKLFKTVSWNQLQWKKLGEKYYEFWAKAPYTFDLCLDIAQDTLSEHEPSQPSAGTDEEFTKVPRVFHYSDFLGAFALKKKKSLEAIGYIKCDSGSFILGSGTWREGGLFPGEDTVLLINKGKKNSDAHLLIGNSPPKWKTLWTLKIY